MVDSAGGLGLSDHVCWVYDGDDAYLAPGLTWLADGRRLNQRLIYVADRSLEQMRDDVAPLGDVDRLLDAGALQLEAMRDLYDLDGDLDAQAQVGVFRAANAQALQEGYAGLRILAEGTPLAPPARRPALHCYEHAAERFMGDGNPTAAFCAYDRSVIGDAAARELLALHAVAHAGNGGPGFQLVGEGDRVKLTGTVAGRDASLLATLAQRVLSRGPTALDLDDLEAIDDAGLQVLAGLGSYLRLRGGPEGARRRWRELGLATATNADWA